MDYNPHSFINLTDKTTGQYKSPVQLNYGYFQLKSSHVAPLTRLHMLPTISQEVKKDCFYF